MIVSSIQLEAADVKNKQVILSHALDMMDKCKGADLIVLPELWNVGFFNYDNYKNFAESIDGETVSALSKKAKELSAYVYTGSFVEEQIGRASCRERV